MSRLLENDDDDNDDAGGGEHDMDELEAQREIHADLEVQEEPAVAPEKRIRPIPVSLGKPSLRIRLEHYYSLVAPSIVEAPDWRERFAKIYDKYGGSHEGEAKLAHRLAKKYGTLVRLLTVTKAAEGTTTLNATRVEEGDEAVASRTTRDESYYELTAAQKGSGILDFSSALFDPHAILLRASHAEVVRVNPIVASVPLYERVDLCRCFLPPEDPLYRPLRPVKAPPQRTEPKPTTSSNPFVLLAQEHTTGPLSMLHRALTTRKPIQITIRGTQGVRGTIRGKLLAFDKHLNLMVQHATESYSVESTDEYLSMAEREILRRQAIPMERHLEQTLIRGDAIVKVSWVGEQHKKK